MLGNLAGEPRDLLSDHVVSCRKCTELVQGILRVHAASRPGTAERTGWRHPARLVLAAAAVLGLVAIIPLWFVTSPTRRTPTGERGLVESASRLSPPDGAQLREAPVRFEWERDAEKDRSQVVLFNEEMTRIWESPWETGESTDLSALSRELLPPGRTYYWRIVTKAGARQRQSPLYRFELLP